MKNLTFKQFKEEILKRAKEKEACGAGYDPAEASKNFAELFKVIGDNFYWCCNNSIIDTNLLAQIDIEILNTNNFFMNQDTNCGFLLAWDSATVRAWGSATVLAWGSATVEAWDSATVEASDSATVLAWGSATVRAWGSATVEAWDSVTVEAWDSVTVEAWDSVTVRAWGSATVEAWDSATVEASDSVTVRASGSAYINSLNTIEHKISERVVLRYYYENRIVLAKQCNK